MSFAMLGACDMDRYVIVQEPFCDWAVFDTTDDVPATVDGQVAIGLSLSEAIFLAAKANASCSGKKSLPVTLLALSVLGHAA